eukprot:5880254-Prymnesium_polylepis.1
MGNPHPRGKPPSHGDPWGTPTLPQGLEIIFFNNGSNRRLVAMRFLSFEPCGVLAVSKACLLPTRPCKTTRNHRLHHTHHQCSLNNSHLWPFTHEVQGHTCSWPWTWREGGACGWACRARPCARFESTERVNSA